MPGSTWGKDYNTPQRQWFWRKHILLCLALNVFCHFPSCWPTPSCRYLQMLLQPSHVPLPWSSSFEKVWLAEPGAIQLNMVQKMSRQVNPSNPTLKSLALHLTCKIQWTPMWWWIWWIKNCCVAHASKWDQIGSYAHVAECFFYTMFRLGKQFDHVELRQVLLLHACVVQICKRVDTIHICMHALQHLLILVVSMRVNHKTTRTVTCTIKVTCILHTFNIIWLLYEYWLSPPPASQSQLYLQVRLHLS